MIHNKKWFFVLVALMTVAGLVLAACAPKATPAANKPYRVGIFSDLTTVNLWAYLGPQATVWNAYVLAPERLTLYGLADRTFQLVPSVADGMPSALTQEGNMWVSTVKMHQGIKWSDGNPLTARDVAFTANTSLELGLPGNWASIFDPNYLDHVEATDDYTVKFIYHTKPGLAVHEYNALQAYILSEAYWGPVVEQAKSAVGAVTKPGENATDEEMSAYEDAKAEALNVLFGHVPDGEPLAGSYLFSKWETGAFAENMANSGYYFSGVQVTEYANGAYSEGKENLYQFTMYGDATGDVDAQWTVGPFASSAIYTLYGTQDAAVLALKNGEIDFMLNPLGLQRGLRSQLEGQPGVSVIENPTNGFRYLAFNCRRMPMSDIAFRQAVATLIDKEFVTRTVLQGVAFPLYTFIPEGNAFWYSAGVTKWGLKEDGTGMSREERLNAAIGILEAAGYTWEGGVKPAWDPDNLQVVPGGTLVMPNGDPVPEIELLAPSPGYDPLRSTFAIWIEQWLNEVGIPVKANLTGFNIIVTKVFDEQDFDMWILGWSLTIFPDYVRDFFHSERAGLGDNNAGGYSNPQFDALSDEIKTCDTLDSCKAIADQIQQVLSTELPYVVLFDTGIVEAYRSEAVEYPYTASLGGLQFVNGLPATVLIK
jgi:ABC-type transport system substrate-binding protein